MKPGTMSANRSRHLHPAATTAAGVAIPWEHGGRAEVLKVIRRGAGKNLPVVFDFDNTITRGDIGEATLAMLAHSGRLTAATLPAGISPTFRPADGKRRALRSFPNIVDYYMALLKPTAHGVADPTPYTTGYAWAIEVMAGMRLTDVVGATRQVLAMSRAKETTIEVMPGRTPIPVPRFHPEVVELLVELIRHEFDVWIVSASNVWTVRVTVQEALNPLLREQGAGAGIQANQVIGISTLLTDPEHRLYKDALLVQEDPGYARLDAKAISRLRLTNKLVHPTPTYSGKVACILDAIGRRPYLGVGDSPGDRAMLAVSEHQLWVTRDPVAPECVATRLVRSSEDFGWAASRPQGYRAGSTAGRGKNRATRSKPSKPRR